MKKSRTLILIIALLAPVSLLGQDATPRILIVGDSWAASVATKHHDPIPPGFGSFDAVLKAAGYEDIRTEGSRTAWGGRKASDWAKPEHLAIIREELERHESIDIVHLIIGGNDFLSLAQKEPVEALRGKSPEERDKAYWQPVIDDIRRIMETALETRPDVRVVLADYDYLDPAAMEKVYGFDFHGATTEEVNQWLEELGEAKETLAKDLNKAYAGRVGYVKNWGILQEAFESAAKGPAGGMPAAAQVGDGVHPNDPGHRALLENALKLYYRAWLAKAPAEATVPSP